MKTVVQKLRDWPKQPNLGQIGPNFGPDRPNFENLTPWLLINSNKSSSGSNMKNVAQKLKDSLDRVSETLPQSQSLLKRLSPNRVKCNMWKK